MLETASSAFAPLIPHSLARVLPSLALQRSRIAWGQPPGAHLTRRVGASVEFREHRPYQPGDDPRTIDWRAAARRDRIVTRFGEREDASPVYILLDTHAGMAYGEDPQTERWNWVRGFAACLAGLALRSGDPVAIHYSRPNGTHRPPATKMPERLRQQAAELQLLKPFGLSPLRSHILALENELRSPALIVVLSDWLDLRDEACGCDEAQNAIMSALARFRARGHQVLACEFLHVDELEFRFAEGNSNYRFEDPRNVVAPIHGDPSRLRNTYLEALHKHREELQTQARRAHIHWSSMRSDRDWGEQLRHCIHAFASGIDVALEGRA